MDSSPKPSIISFAKDGTRTGINNPEFTGNRPFFFGKGGATLTNTELNRLSSLIKLKYKSLHDGQKVLGDADNIRNTFIDFQKHLY